MGFRMNPPVIRVAVEGSSDEALARTLLEEIGFSVDFVYVQQGKNRLDQKRSAFNHAAENAPWLILRDMDHDADCAPELIRELMPAPSAKMCFRIAVHTAEAWLLADRKNISRFLGVPLNKLMTQPDTLDNPKIELVNLARRSNKKNIRADMVPAKNATTTVGPAYVSRLVEFATDFWDPTNAASHSLSLQKCVDALHQLLETQGDD